MEPANINNSPACIHAAFFSDGNGNMSYESIMEGQRKMGITGGLAHLRALAVVKVSGKEKSLKNVCQMENPARSGIWNKDGSFNEAQFNELATLSVKLKNGKQGVTESIFNEFLYQQHGDKFSGFMVTVFPLPFPLSYVPMPITSAQVTGGSVAAFFDKFRDSEYDHDNAITLDRLYKYYTQPEIVTAEVVQENAI